MIGIEAFKCYPASLWMLLERKNRVFETVEPGRALAWRALDQPQIQFLKLNFRALRNLNAVCHACAADL